MYKDTNKFGRCNCVNKCNGKGNGIWKGKGNIAWDKMEKGNARPTLLPPDPTRQSNRTYARTNETKRFPGWCPTPQPPTKKGA